MGPRGKTRSLNIENMDLPTKSYLVDGHHFARQTKSIVLSGHVVGVQRCKDLLGESLVDGRFDRWLGTFCGTTVSCAVARAANSVVIISETFILTRSDVVETIMTCSIRTTIHPHNLFGHHHVFVAANSHHQYEED